MSLSNTPFAASAAQKLSCTIQKAKYSPDLHNAYLNGQKEALSCYGLSDLVPNEFSDEELENTYLVAFYDDSQMLGGVKIYLRTAQTPLPIEGVVKKHQALHKLPEKLDQMSSRIGVCETGALWATNSRRGQLLSIRMIKTASDFAFNLGFGACLGFIGPAIKTSLRVGYVRDNSFSPVAYPDDRFLSQIVWRFKEEQWGKEYGAL